LTDSLTFQQQLSSIVTLSEKFLTSGFEVFVE
jgi:hypothetical protein